MFLKKWDLRTEKDSRKADGGRRAVSLWKRLCVLAVLLCACGAMWGETYYWVGGNAGNWDAETNWNTKIDGSGANGVPGAYDTAIIDRVVNGVTITLTSNVSVGTLSSGSNQWSGDDYKHTIKLNGYTLSVDFLDIGISTIPSSSGPTNRGSYLVIENTESTGSISVKTLDTLETRGCILELNSTKMTISETYYVNTKGTGSFNIVFSGTNSSVDASNADGGIYSTPDQLITAAGGASDNIKVRPTSYTWTGDVNTDWDNPNNWAEGAGEYYPNSGSLEVSIPSGCTNYPQLDVNVNLGLKPITVASGATVDLNGHQLSTSKYVNQGTLTGTGGTISGSFENSGTIDLTSGSLTIAGNFENKTGAVVRNGNVNVAGTLTDSGTWDNTVEITLNGSNDTSSPQIFNNNASTTYPTVIVSNNVSITNNFGVNKLTVATGKTLTAANITVSTAAIAGTITTTGSQTYTGAVTVDDDVTFEARTGITFGADITGTGHEVTFDRTVALTSDVTFTADNLIFNGGFNTSTYDVTIAGNAVIYGDNTFNNFTCTGSTLDFGAGTTQTINGKITLSDLTLDSTDKTTPTQFTLSVTYADDIHVAITNVTVNNSISGRSPGGDYLSKLDLLGVGCTNGGNTKKWFPITKYKWIGATDTSWDTDANWEDEEGDNTAPPKDKAITEITIDNSSSNVLTLTADITAKSITVNSGQTVDFGKMGVTVNGEDGIINNGTIRLTGGGTITGTMQNGSGSTIEYYGAFTEMPWDGDDSDDAKTYVNLVFSDGASVDECSEKISVTGKTTISIAATDSVILSNEDNIFTDSVTINSGTSTLSGAFKEQIEINATKSVSLSGTFDKTIELKSILENLTFELISDATLNVNHTGTTNFTASSKDPATSIYTLTVDGEMTVLTKTEFTDCNLKIVGKTSGGVDGGLKLQGTATIGGDFINAGEFRASNATDTISVTGNVDDSNGTWNHTGQLIFNGDGTKTQYFINKTTKEYPDVKINGKAVVEVCEPLSSTFDPATDTTTKTELKVTKLAVGDTNPAKLSAGGVTVSDATSIHGTITTTGNQTYKESVTLTGDATFVAVDNSSSPSVPKTITFGTSSTPGFVSDDGAGTAIGTAAHKLKITGDAVIYGDNTFDDITIDNSGIEAATTVSFEADKLQTITGCSFKGCKKDDEIYPLTLTTTDTSNKWKVYFTTKPVDAKFDFVHVKSSISYDDAGTTETAEPWLTQSGNHASDPDDSTKNWFKEVIYYWIGGADSNWANINNWKYDVNDTSTVANFPKQNSKIVIDTGNETPLKPKYHDLDLDSGVKFTTGSNVKNIKVKSLTIKSGKRIDLGECTIEAPTDLTANPPIEYGVINYGTICLDGTNTKPFSDGTTPPSSAVTTIWHSNGKDIDGTTNNIYSTIEYDSEIPSTNPFPLYYEYDNTTDPINPVTKFVNLSFAEGASCDFSGCIEVLGTTTITAGAGNAISLTNTANTFTGDVTIGKDDATSPVNGGVVSLAGTGEIQIANCAYCDSLEMLESPSTDTTAKTKLLGSVTTVGTPTGTQTYGNPVVIPNGGTLSGTSITFSSTSTIEDSKTLTIKGNFQHDDTITGGTPNGSTVKFIGTGTSPDPSYTITSNNDAEILADVVIDTTGMESLTTDFTCKSLKVETGTFAIADGKSVTVNGDLTNTAEGVIGSVAATETISVKGDLTDSGDMTNVAEIIFCGNAEQTFDLNPDTEYLNVKACNTNNSGLVINGNATFKEFSDTTTAGNITFNGSENKITSIGNSSNLLTTGAVTFGNASNTTNETIIASENGLTHIAGTTKIAGTITSEYDDDSDPTTDAVPKNLTFGAVEFLSSTIIDCDTVSLASATTSEDDVSLTVKAKTNITGGTSPHVVTTTGPQTYKDTVAVSGDVTFTAKNASDIFAVIVQGGGVTSTGAQTYLSILKVETQSATFTGTTITLEGNATADVDCSMTFAGNVVVPNSIGETFTVTTTGTGETSFFGDVNCGANLVCDSVINIGQDDNTSVNFSAKNITFKKDASVKNVVLSNTGVLTTPTDVSIFVSNKLVQQSGSGKIMIGGNLDASGTAGKSDSVISFANDVYLYGSPSASLPVKFGGGDCKIETAGNLIIAYDSEIPIEFNSPVTAKNIVLYAGDLKVNKNLSSTEDVVLLGAKYADNSGISDHGADEYKYTKHHIIPYSYTGFDSETLDERPDGTALPTSYKGTFTVAKDVAVEVGKNFFANGISLKGESSMTDADCWYLDATENSDPAVCFVEAYITEIDHSVVRCYKKNDGTRITPIADYGDAEPLVMGMADDSCIDNGFNENWDFAPFEILGAYTVSDNVVCVELSSPFRNSHGELEHNIGNIKFENNGVKESFAEAYRAYEIKNQVESSEENVRTPIGSTEDIVSSYERDGRRIYYFYLKTNAAFDDKDSTSRWNTDATGTSVGSELSTDNHGKHQSAIPSIEFARVITDANGNKISFTNRWGKILQDSGKTFDKTTDGAPPVLTAVYTGQETHNPNASEQHSYDAHNYLEFVFSEPVDFGTTADESICWLPAFADDGVTPSVLENGKSSETFGGTDGKSGGISISGLAKINGGSLVTGSAGAENNVVHGFYRSNPYKVKFSIAGYTDGVVTDNDGNEYKNWIGYIDSASTPADGSLVELQENTLSFVNDIAVDVNGEPAPNSCKFRNSVNYVNGEDLKLNFDSSETQSSDETKGAWDVIKPGFAVYRRAIKEWNKEALLESEAIGSTIDGTSSLKRIEFHLFDNEPVYDSSEEYQWVSKHGWVNPFDISDPDSLSLYREYSYAADTFGGSRPFVASPDEPDSLRTAGGIRYCSIAESAAAFKYGEGIVDEPSLPFDTSLKAFVGAASPIFIAVSTPSRNPATSDSPYFALNFANPTTSIRAQFTISYDSSKGCITDLAGNRLGNSDEIKIRTKDLTPPSFNMTVAPVGQNKIYVMINKTLRTETVTLLDEFGNKVTKDALSDAYPKAFGLFELSHDADLTTEVSDIAVDQSVPVKVLYETKDHMGFELTLTRDLTYEDIRKLYLVVKPSPEKYRDPVIDIASNVTTFLQDDDDNYMAAYTAHALSDYAVNLVNPLYAYDAGIIDENGNSKVQINLYGDGSNAVHDWNAEQQNYGTLLPDDEIHIISSVDLSSSGTPEYAGEFNVRMYLDGTPLPESVSVEYNFTTPDLYDWRIWLPEIPGFSPFKPLSTVANNTVEYTVDGIQTGEGDLDFVIPKDAVSENWKSGDQITFMFALNDLNNQPLTVVHTPVYDYETNKYSLSDKFPMFALRLKTPGDLTSVDLWSFRLKAQKNQRGGVTILNNVINALNSEKTVVKVENPSSGKVDVIVMTLDGNIIEYLNRGNLDSGTHYFTWNGHNRSGKAVARGMYFIRVIGNGFDETRKVMVVK